MPRIRELGIYDSALPTGPRNAITDVAGVSVGHCTVIEGEGAWTGDGPFRTGVTVILPHGGNLYADKVAGAVHRINGFGKYAGFEQIRETGTIETPIALTSTLNMPRVADALITLGIEENPHIGTASRVVPEAKGGFTVGVLVQTNFGRAAELVICGVPAGRHLRPANARATSGYGSIMMAVATDAPLDGRQLERLCTRAAFGLARTGSHCHTGSGDVVIGFSTTHRVPDRPDGVLMARDTLADEHWVLSALGQGVIEGIEEAIWNSMLMSPTMVGRDGNTRHGLPPDEAAALVRGHRPDG